MQTETRKIDLACFVGGAICCAACIAATLYVSPRFWWLGVIAGFAVGYLAFEFGEVLRAIPIAWKSARKGSSAAEKAIRTWFAEPHPFFYPFFPVATSLSLLLVYSMVSIGPEPNEPLLLLIISVTLVFVILSLTLVWGLAGLAAFGARRVEHSWFFCPIIRWTSSDIAEFGEEGLSKVEPTYWNVIRWTLEGFIYIVWQILKQLGIALYLIGWFFVWGLWKGICRAICFSGRFVWHVFLYIRSHKRLFCGTCGATGGSISYALTFFVQEPLSGQEQLLFVLFGGLIAAAIGRLVLAFAKYLPDRRLPALAENNTRP